VPTPAQRLPRSWPGLILVFALVLVAAWPSGAGSHRCVVDCGHCAAADGRAGATAAPSCPCEAATGSDACQSPCQCGDASREVSTPIVPLASSPASPARSIVAFGAEASARGERVGFRPTRGAARAPPLRASLRTIVVRA
jgi:hypothetical protein